MPIEGISLEIFSSVPKNDINLTTPSRQRHAVFHSFLSDEIKQDAATTSAQRKYLISLLKDKNYQPNHWVQYGKTMIIFPNNIDVPLHYTLCQLCINVTSS